MAQVSYGTITITDTNDIESIIVEYNRNQSTSSPPDQNDSGWSTNRPAWAQGYYIWQRTRIHKSGTQASADTFGTAVCLTGSTGQPGATGKGIIGIETLYATNNSTTTAPTSGWQSQPPTYSSSNPKYWVKVTTTYNSGNPDVVTYLDNGITDAMATAAAANTTANNANQTANNANQTANNAYSIATGINQHFWTIATDYATGLPAGSYITDVASDTFKSQKTGGNLLTRSDGIWVRDGIKTLASLTGSSFVFYRPTTTTAQGSKGMELTSSTLKFYDDTGAVAQATFGGTQATISGTINVYDGKIGNNANNYWYIGNYTDYNQNNSAIIKSKGTASIQLDETNTWRISTNRIHTAWAPETGTDAFLLHYPKFNDSSSNNKYWDYGLHLPTSNSDKFLYIRNASGSETLDNLLNDLDDYGYNYWTYKFYIDGEGNIHAGDIYSHDTLISGQSAPYLLKSGGTITGALEVNGTLTKGGKNVAYLTATPTNGQILIADGTSGGIKTSGYTIAKSVPSDAAFTDKNVQTSQTNTTKIFLAGTSTSGTSTGTLSYDSNVYLTTTAGVLHATTFEGNLSGTATKANQDSDGNVIKTTYLKLSGGNVTGPVSFGSSVSADELTVGSLIVNGSGSFTNGLYGDLIGNATSASKLGSSTIGAADRPIYLNAGTATQTTYRMASTNVAATTALAISNNLDTGIWYVNGTNSNDLYNQSDGAAYVNKYSDSWIAEIYQDYRTGQIALRGKNNGTWQAWRKVLDSSNYNTWVPKLDGTGATGTWAINISGNAAKDGSGNTITSYYAPKSTAVTNVAYDSTNNKITKTINGSTTDVVTVATIKSAIASLKNPNALKVRVYSGTSAPTDTSYDGSTANQSVEVAGKSAIVNITAAPKTSSSDVTTFTLTKADGTPSTFDISIIASAATGATMLKDSSGAISLGGLTNPVYFSGGVPAEASTYAGGTAVTLNGSSKAASTASFYAPSGGGTADQVLISKGNAAPEWTNQSSLSIPWSNITSKPTTLSGAVEYLGVLTALGSGTPADATQTYWIDNIPNNTVKAAYNTSGAEWSLIFSRGGSANYGSVLRWGYPDLYLYLLRRQSGNWKATDWEKISAGYADSAGIATKDSGDNVIASTYLKKAGDTMTDILTLYREGTTENNYPAGINFSTKDTTTGQSAAAHIYAYQDHASSSYGTNMVICSGGGMFLGSGESPDSHYSAKGASYNGEDTFITSDGTMYIQANGQQIANRLGFYISTAHDIVPCKADVATNNVGSIGTSSFKWANMYATTFHGALDGDATNVSGTVAIGHGGTGATTAAAARSNLGTWSLVSDSYNTLMPADGTTNGWIKFGTSNTSYGILPSAAGNAGSGHNYIGTSTWYWKYAYIDQITGYLNGNISGNAATATKSGVSAIWLYPENNNEINIGGTHTGTIIYLGYRAKDSRPIPTKIVFGGSTGSTELQASSFNMINKANMHYDSTLEAIVFSFA